MRTQRATVTLKDVAARAGVSTSTASRVLHGGKPVSSDLEARVRQVAVELDYRADASARALRGQRGHLAILADELGVEALAELATAVVGAGEQAGLTTTITSAGSDPERQLKALRVIRALGPRAVLLTGGWVSSPEIAERLTDELTEYVEQDGGRVVVMGPPSIPFASIGFDDLGIGVEIGRHAADAGIRSAVILAGPAAHRGFRERTEGFVTGLRAGGVDDVRVVHGRNQRDEAARVLSRSLDDRSAEAVLAVSDRMAVGAYDEIDRRGLQVPGDVVVTGVDDLSIAADLVPGLTTVRQPFRAAGELAIRLLVSDGAPAVENHTLRGTLVARGSTNRSAAS